MAVLVCISWGSVNKRNLQNESIRFKRHLLDWLTGWHLGSPTVALFHKRKAKNLVVVQSMGPDVSAIPI